MEVENKKNNYSLSPVSCYELLMSVKENNDRKRKKTRKKEKNTDRTHTILNTPHIMYNVKIRIEHIPY